MAENFGPVRDTIFTVQHSVAELDTVVAEGTLTAQAIINAWHRDRVLKNYRQIVQDLPRSLERELAPRVTSNGAPSALISWNPTYGIRLPYVVNWLLSPHIEERRQAFEALEMDRAQFVRELLDDPFFGVRMRYEVAEHPYLLTFLPEEERWQRLEQALVEHATAIGWWWPHYTAKHWSKDRTIELVRKLIKHPELASSFLVGDGAPGHAWSLFRDLDIFIYLLREAGRVAPFELAMAHQWIATYIGDRIVHQDGSSFMDEPTEEDAEYRWYGWWMDPEGVHKEFGPKGQQLMTKLVDEVLKDILTADESLLSSVSQFFVRQIKAVTAKITMKTARDLAELLIEFPECAFGHELMEQLVDGCEVKYLDQAYRWLLSVRRRFDLTRFHVLVRVGEWRDEAAFWEITWGEDLIRKSWLLQALRAGMETYGWRICSTEWHENRKQGRFDLQVRTRFDGVNNVYNIWWPSNSGFGDYVPKYPRDGKNPPTFEVMIPPGFKPGEIKFKNADDTFRIYHVGSDLLLCQPWSIDYVRKCGG